MAPKAGWEVRVQSQLDSAGLPKTYGYNGNAWVEKPGGSGGTGGGGTGGDVYLTKAIANGVLDLSATTANLWGVTLTSNVTTLTLPTTANYYSMSVIFTQDSTGGRTVAFPSSVKWTNGPVALNTAPGTTTILSFLTVDKGVNWFGFAAPATGSNTSLTNPMTSAGDLIVGGANGVPSRLPKGPDGSVLTMVNGALAWAASTGGTGSFAPMPLASPITGSSTLALASANTFRRVAVGNSTPVVLTIPPESSVAFPVGTELAFIQDGRAPIKIAQGSGVSFLIPEGRLPQSRAYRSVISIKKLDSDYWEIQGDLMPFFYDFNAPGGYTLQDRDRWGFIRNTDSKGTNAPITLPADDSWIGVEVTVLNWNGASIAFNNGTVRLPPGKKNTSTQAGQVVRLRCLEAGVWSVSGELDTDPATATSVGSKVVSVTDATVDLGKSDGGIYIRASRSAGVTLQIQTQDTYAYPDNMEVEIEQTGAGQVTILPVSGVTVNVPAGYNKKTAKQFAVIALKRVAQNEWTLMGNLEASS